MMVVVGAFDCCSIVLIPFRCAYFVRAVPIRLASQSTLNTNHIAMRLYFPLNSPAKISFS